MRREVDHVAALAVLFVGRIVFDGLALARHPSGLTLLDRCTGTTVVPNDEPRFDASFVRTFE